MASSIETLDLSAGGDSGMVNINNSFVPKPEEKNISKQQNTPIMDSTPIDDIMGMNDLGGGSPLTQDPRMVAPQAPMGNIPNQNVMQQAQMAQAQQGLPIQKAAEGSNSVLPSKNPLNLTDEQLEALFVGAIAVLAFSRPVQEKMAQLIPKFLNDNGSRSTMGVGVTGISAAVLYFFGRKFVMKN